MNKVSLTYIAIKVDSKDYDIVEIFLFRPILFIFLKTEVIFNFFITCKYFIFII